MRSKSQVIVFAALLLTVFMRGQPLHAIDEAVEDPGSLTVSPGRVNYHGGSLKSIPSAGSVYIGNLLVEKAEPPRKVISETWRYRSGSLVPETDGSKPPELTTYTLTQGATGMGELHLRITGKNGFATVISYDVGTFRTTDAKPVSRDVDQVKNFFVEHLEMHTVVHQYESWYNRPSKRDDCVPILNRGNEFEVLPGEETLRAFGKISASK